jgi:hypothetical protein
MKYIILFIFLPFLTNAQELYTKYDSYFQTISDPTEIHIYHTLMVVVITDKVVEIGSEVEGEFTVLALFNVEWQVGNEYLLSNIEDRIVFYYPKINKLVVINILTKVESVFYGTPIPTHVEIPK